MSSPDKFFHNRRIGVAVLYHYLIIKAEKYNFIIVRTKALFDQLHVNKFNSQWENSKIHEIIAVILQLSPLGSWRGVVKLHPPESHRHYERVFVTCYQHNV